MKIVALYGGPRPNGNTALLMKEILAEAQKQGAETEVFNLNKLNYKGCQACYSCKHNLTCAIKDEAQPVLAAIAAADRILIASPIYMWDITGQLKMLLDRLFCFLNTDYTSKLQPGKKVLWAITQGQVNLDLFRPVVEKHGKMLEFLGFGENQVFIAGGLANPGEILKQPEVLQAAREKAGWLVQ